MTHTSYIQREFNGDKLAPRGMFRRLRRPHGDDRVKHPGPAPVDQAGHDHPHVILGGTLQGCADDRDAHGEGDGLYPSRTLADDPPYERAAKTAEVVDGDYPALAEGVGDDRRRHAVYHCGVAQAHGLDVILGAVDSAHHTPDICVSAHGYTYTVEVGSLVVAEEEDGNPADRIDGEEQRPFLEDVREVEAGHGGGANHLGELPVESNWGGAHAVGRAVG